MRPIERRARELLAAALLCGVACLAGCLDGTSTDTPNTAVPGRIKGVALRTDGTPAAGARVTLRSDKVVIDTLRQPAWRLLDDAVTDSRGRFEVEAPDSLHAYLEIALPAIGDSATAEVYFAEFDSGEARPTASTSFRLEPAGSLSGLLAAEDGHSLTGRWIGVPGSSAVTLLDTPVSGKHPFRLDGLYPGSRKLELIEAGEVTVQSLPGSLPLVEVKPSELIDLGPIFYNGTSPAVADPL